MKGNFRMEVCVHSKLLWGHGEQVPNSFREFKEGCLEEVSPRWILEGRQRESR